MVYARKISEDSWFGKDILDSDSLSELTTTNHELSVWKVDDISNENKIDDIALALALSRDAVDEFFIVFIDSDRVDKEYKWNVEIHDEDGLTGFDEMKGVHTNFVLLTMWQQGFLAEHINNLIKDSKNYKFYDVATLVDLLNVAVNNGRIDKDLLKKKYGKWNKKLKELESLKDEGVLLSPQIRA